VDEADVVVKTIAPFAYRSGILFDHSQHLGGLLLHRASYSTGPIFIVPAERMTSAREWHWNFFGEMPAIESVGSMSTLMTAAFSPSEGARSALHRHQSWVRMKIMFPVPDLLLGSCFC